MGFMFEKLAVYQKAVVLVREFQSNPYVLKITGDVA